MNFIAHRYTYFKFNIPLLDAIYLVDLKQMKPLEVPEAFRERFMLILEPGAEARTEGSAR